MSRIEKTFAQLRKKKESALIMYIPVGYPSLELSESLIRAIAESGADIIELGVPYADPLADGPVIQEACLQAVNNGANLDVCLETVNKLRALGINTPIVFMGYCNSFLAYGLERLAVEAVKVGVDGFIIPDLPSTMAQPWVQKFEPHGLDLIFFLAPTTSEERAAAVVKQGSGFLYCISVAGVTGMRQSLPDELPGFIQQIREQSTLPLAVGFGISNEQHVKEVSSYADGAIVGSALIQVIKQASPNTVEADVRGFVRKLKEATKRVAAGQAAGR